MDNLEQEKNNLFQLIETWQEENVKLALQIVKGNKELKAAALDRYMPMIKHVLGGNSLKILQEVEAISYYQKGDAWKPNATTIEVLSTVPIYEIDITNSQLTIFPEWICCLTQLKRLYLNRNRISTIPKSIGNLRSLQVLNLDDNDLASIPDTLGNLSLLEKLNLDFNHITEIPSSIGNLSNLKWLCLERNEIAALPKSLINLKSLTWLSVEGTPLGKKHRITYGMYVRVSSSKVKKLLGLED